MNSAQIVLTGLSRSKARTLKEKGFTVTPHGRCGLRKENTVIAGYTGVLDDLLRKGVTNSEVCFERIASLGYEGGVTTVKNYIAGRRDLVPAKRKVVEPSRSGRGERYSTEPGEAYQMDWGFVAVEDWRGEACRIACFAMVCHHCGTAYVEFFTNARQENLFIGMVHAFMAMGVPERVVTDNMKSVVTRRDYDGRSVWQADYASFMDAVGFKTTLCKPRHPFTKGKVERLIRFVKGNFLARREFTDITQLNAEALAWCAAQAARFRKPVACVPAEEHAAKCLPTAIAIALDDVTASYLCPRRRISFDGFVNYEGRRFGVPYWYPDKTCRVNREGRRIHIYSDDLSRELACHLCFCDPMQSRQKGRAERCHEELGRILPKGKTDFDALTCRDMAACTSRVNSYLRGNMEWMAPVEMAGLVLPPGVLGAYGVEAVDPREVDLTPQLVPHSIARL